MHAVRVLASEDLREVGVVGRGEGVLLGRVDEAAIELREPCSHALDFGLLEVRAGSAVPLLLVVEVGAVGALGTGLEAGDGDGVPGLGHGMTTIGGSEYFVSIGSKAFYLHFCFSREANSRSVTFSSSGLQSF